MNDDDTPPAPYRQLQPQSDDAEELRETLDLLGTVMASLSDRVDGQTAALDRLTRTAAETRSAALHARDRMDMAPVAEALSEGLDRNIVPLANELIVMRRNIEADRVTTKRQIEDFMRGTSEVLEQRRRRIEGLQARSWVPLFALIAFLMVLATALLAPWAIGKLSGELLCRLADGFWLQSSRSCGF